MKDESRSLVPSEPQPVKPYLTRFIKQVWESTLELGEKQQIFTWAVVLIITTIVGIYYGIVTGEPVTALLAVLSSIGLIFLVILLFNIIRTPFILDRKSNEFIEELKQKTKSLSFDSTNLIEVKYRSFSNERVLLDGHSYTDCTFTNVKFVYNGTAAFNFNHNTLRAGFSITSESDAVAATFLFLQGFGYLKEGVPLLGENEKPLERVNPPKVTS